MAHTLRGAIANFKQHPDNIERQHRTRERAMKAFEHLLEGKDLQVLATQADVHLSTIKAQASDIARILYFRVPDREKVKDLKPLLSSVKKNPEVWKALYEEHKDRVRPLTPPEK